MAANFTVSEDEVSCPVCHDIFTCPVVLPCSHSLCKDCLQQCQRAGFEKCPLCKRACAPGTDPPVNLALKNLCERFHLEQEAAGGSQTLCSLHGEKLKLFCLVDKQPICADCVPNLHDRHKCCHLKVAVHEHKMKMQTALKPLEEKLEIFKRMSESGDEKLHHIKSQFQRTEKQIKAQFQELHQILRQEEAARIAALRAEEVQRRQTLSSKMAEVVREMEALSTTVRAIQQEMGKDDVSFLQNYNETMKRTRHTVQDPEVSGVLIDVAKHLGNLKLHVCQTLLGVAKYTPVILDPNTASPSVVLSEDLTSVITGKPGSYMENIPLFGSHGFSSGKHQWDVEVHQDAVIDIGIAKKGWGREEMDGCRNDQSCTGGYSGGCDGIGEQSKRGGMVKIRVLVDCEQRTLSLFDVYGNKPFHPDRTYTLTGKLFPFFCFRCIGSEHQFNLKILPVRAKVIGCRSVFSD